MGADEPVGSDEDREEVLADPDDNAPEDQTSAIRFSFDLSSFAGGDVDIGGGEN